MILRLFVSLRDLCALCVSLTRSIGIFDVGGEAMVRAVERLLITGAAGNIGTVLREGLRGAAPILRLMDRVPLSAGPGEEVLTGDVRVLEDARRAAAGCDALVHLAAIAEEAPFEAILDVNVRGTYNVFEAARLEGCRRVVFASSNHVTGFHPVGEMLTPEAPVRPDSYYGVSKTFGEALGRLYHDRHGLEVACLRIGTFADRPRTERHLSTWLSHRDAVQLVRRCLEAPSPGFVTLYGTSGNRRSWWQSPGWEVVGYRPQDNAEHYAAEVTGSPADYRFQGGDFTG
jgi:uronate dehydrogenase